MIKAFPAAIIMFGLVTLMPGHAQARWFIGAELTQAESDQGVGFDSPPETETDDGSDSSWKLLAGYNFSSRFSVEVAYSDLGNEYSTFNILGNNEKIEMDVSAINASLVGKTRVFKYVDFFGRLGLAYWNVDLDYVDATFSSSGSDYDMDLVLGIGFIWHISQSIGARLEWEQFQNIGDEANTDLPSGNLFELNGQDINVLAVGLTFTF